MMKFKREQIRTQALQPPPTAFLRFVVDLFVCVSYLDGILGTKSITLTTFLLFTVTYSAWLVVFHRGKQSGEGPHPSWLLTLFCLACVSQFISILGLHFGWLWLLPMITAGLMSAIRQRFLGVIAAFSLWLSSSVASIVVVHRWDPNSQLMLLLTFILVFGFVSTIRELALAHTRMQQLITALQGSNAELEAAHTRLQEYTNQVEDLSAMRERNRIAREIHDTLGHSLTLLSVQLETATRLEERCDDGLHEELLEARRVARECLTDVRHSVAALRPDSAIVGSFNEALRRLVAEFEMTCHETEITLDLEEATHTLSPELRMALYRCAQEALTNIRKHASATKVLLRLSTSEEQAELTVLDNGQGCTSQDGRSVSGFGLLGMRERVMLLDGVLRVGPQAGRGWRVEVVIPSSIASTAMRAGTTRDGA